MVLIPYGKQSISLGDRFRIFNSLGKPMLTTGPTVGAFEDKLAILGGSKSGAVTFTSGTAALHGAYFAADLQPGDEVITSPLSFIATASTATLLGAKVMFADVQEDTGNLNPEIVEHLTNRRTKIITAVDYAGHPADLDELNDIARKHQILLYEDAAHSLGSTYKGRAVGQDADLVAFSFFPTKNITTAEGGALVGRNSKLIEKARSFRSQGLVRDLDKFQIDGQGAWHQEVHNLGLNYRLPDVLCSLGLSQLGRLGKFKMKRSKIFSRYVQGLQGLDGVRLPTSRHYVDPIWHLFPIRVAKERRRSIFDFLRSRGVAVQVNYLPIYWHPAYRDLGYKQGMCPVAEDYYHSEISLPMYSDLKVQDQEKVIDLVKEAIRL